MQENTSSEQNYAGLPVVRVRIVAKKVAWLVVRMADGTRGIIPRREWAWERGLAHTPPTFKEGATLTAVLLDRTTEQGYAYLSIRELQNPWHDVEALFPIGSEVSGEVVNLRGNAAYVALVDAPGVVAELWAGDMPLTADEVPADVLTLGDRLQALILEVDADKKWMRLSVTKWFQGLDARVEAQKERLETMFLPALDALIQNAAPGQSAPPLPAQGVEHQVQALAQLRKVLIIDDDADDRKRLAAQIERTFQTTVLSTNTGEEGMRLLETNPDIDLVILDIGLDHDEYGPNIAARILHQYPQMQLVFTSSDPFRVSEISELEHRTERTFPFVYKTMPLQGAPQQDDSLPEVIRLLFDGLVYRYKYAGVRSMDVEKEEAELFMEQIGAQAIAKSDARDNLRDMLAHLARTNMIEYLAIVALDSAKKSASLVACYPAELEETFQECLDGIYFSQVRDVVEDEETLYVSSLGREEKNTRFKNFFRALRYHCCYGVPIQMAGMPTQHGLFALDSGEDFTWETIMRIRSTANLAAVALERGDMLRVLRKYEERYFMGQFFGTFVHELRNVFEVIKRDLERGDKELRAEEHEKLLARFQFFEKSYNKIKTLSDSFVRYVNEGFEWVDLNAVVQKVHDQLRYSAESESHVRILLDMGEGIPPIYANSLHIEQVLSNVVLNAIQHVSAQFRTLHETARERGYEPPLQLCRAVLIKTSLHESENLCRIAVMDTGPGIPYDQREAIFREGVSSRDEGHGLGLFISRNLAEAMQGRLLLADTLRYGGSAFVITFPIYKT